MEFNTIQGKLTGKNYKIGIVVSRFNEFITNKLLSGAVDCLSRHETDKNNIDVFWVPGAFEIPFAAKKILSKREYDGLICLGAVIRGSTPHFNYVSAEVTKGIAALGMESGVPISFGVITTDTIEQAIERAGTKSGNKGWDAALSVIEMIDLYRQL